MWSWRGLAVLVLLACGKRGAAPTGRADDARPAAAADGGARHATTPVAPADAVVAPAPPADAAPPSPLDAAAPDAAPPPGDWIDAAVAAIVEARGADDNPRRAAAQAKRYRRFFQTHPRYADPAQLERLAGETCVDLEDADKLLAATRTTVETIEVPADAFRVIVAHAESVCTSEDWSFFTDDVQQAATAAKVTWYYASPEAKGVIVHGPGGASTSYTFGPDEHQGYVFLAPRTEPRWHDHDLVPRVLADATDYFGVAIEPILPYQ